LDNLGRYYDQLVCLEQKIPASEIQIPFKWKDAFDRGSIFGGRISLTVSSLAYEKVCVLFNYAALCTMIAESQVIKKETILLFSGLWTRIGSGFHDLCGFGIRIRIHGQEK
jgi:programmed cell death 6-interacting protein